MTAGVFRRRTEPGGPWQRLLRGVYLTVTGTATRDQREIAALRYAGHGSLLTGLAALRRIGVRVPDRDEVTVLVPTGRHVRSTSYVTIWQTTRMPEQVMFRSVVTYARPNRAAADAARELTSLDAVRAVVAQAVQQRWCSVEGSEQSCDWARGGAVRPCARYSRRSPAASARYRRVTCGGCWRPRAYRSRCSTPRCTPETTSSPGPTPGGPQPASPWRWTRRSGT